MVISFFSSYAIAGLLKVEAAYRGEWGDFCSIKLLLNEQWLDRCNCSHKFATMTTWLLQPSHHQKPLHCKKGATLSVTHEPRRVTLQTSQEHKGREY
ncbi:hypothetical protein TNCV_4495901 [Trichonephila clavipes]|nr:hypothetical protein TNCV_4495901 [Trichonephila clavipes]